MIEWKKYEIMRGAQFPGNNRFLVTDGKTVIQATHRYERVEGYQWWDMDGRLLLGITHYAEINYPDNRGGLVNPDGGDYPLKSWIKSMNADG